LCDKQNVTKAITILDSLIYGFGTAFTSFCSSGGLNVLVLRIKEEVDYSLNLVKEAETSQMTGVTSTSTSGKKDEKGMVLFLYCAVASTNTSTSRLNYAPLQL
jgi:hypothetical protein